MPQRRDACLFNISYSLLMPMMNAALSIQGHPKYLSQGLTAIYRANKVIITWPSALRWKDCMTRMMSIGQGQCLFDAMYLFIT